MVKNNNYRSEKAMPNSDFIQLMKEKAETVQAIVSKINHMEQAFRYTIDLTQKQGGKTVAATGLKPNEARLLKKACEASELELLEFPLRLHTHEIHTSLTPVDWGIAETGTLVIDSSSEDVRIATMLAETHVAVLPASKIKPDSAALETELNAVLKAETPSYYAFITGASRTADIERVLTIGVHGPQELHILIVEEDSE
ncbi:MAG TPA: lactate utilization protein [Desulfobacterales bacterium]|nr:lactate utilization protein [Desulfobacterales bacterium]